MIQNKIFKSIISCLLCLIVVCVIFSILKGPNFIFVKYHYYKGYIKQKQGDLNNAILDYSKAIELDKDYPTAYISRGSAYVDFKKHDLAISDYSEAIKINTNNPEPHAYRGKAYYEIGDFEKSLNDYNKAIELDENFIYAYYNRALLRYTKLNEYSSACEDLKKASELGDIDSKQLLKDYCN